MLVALDIRREAQRAAGRVTRAAGPADPRRRWRPEAVPHTSLQDLEVLVVDCQATAASPNGHLIEIGWARLGAGAPVVHARLIRLPAHASLPHAVARVTGLTARALGEGIEAAEAWRALAADAARMPGPPSPAVAHFARFERPFLAALAGGSPALDLVCTHEIARRLFPDLPRCGLRALAGYLGRGVGAPRRSAEHVDATIFVWRELARRLADRGVASWDDLRRWLAAPVAARARGPRVWPMPRAMRLSLPDAPGVYRLLRAGGDVLYVGKATSLRQRVNSYFRQRHDGGERMLEMLSQARDLSFAVTPSALEAALLEADEIKRHRPPYNVALAAEAREVWFASTDLLERAPLASVRHPLGPFPSARTLDRFAALCRGARAAVADDRWSPPEDVFADGLALLISAHPALARPDRPRHERYLRLGARLWRDGASRRDDEGGDEDAASPPSWIWTPERVKTSLEAVALEAALAVRRARWLTRLVESSVAWREAGHADRRLLAIARGDCVDGRWLPSDAALPVPPGHRRTAADRRASLTLARFDRVRVLLTEIKRLAAAGSAVSLRVGPGRPLDRARLARVLAWL